MDGVWWAVYLFTLFLSVVTGQCTGIFLLVNHKHVHYYLWWLLCNCCPHVLGRVHNGMQTLYEGCIIFFTTMLYESAKQIYKKIFQQAVFRKYLSANLVLIDRI